MSTMKLGLVACAITVGSFSAALAACGSNSASSSSDAGVAAPSDAGVGVDASTLGSLDGATIDAPPDAPMDAPNDAPNWQALAGDLCQATYLALRDALDSCCTPADRQMQAYQLMMQVFFSTKLCELAYDTLNFQMTYDAAKIAQCKADVAASLAARSYCYEDYRRSMAHDGEVPAPLDHDSCRTALIGARVVGDDCFHDYECADGLQCAAGFNAGGKCRPPGAEGEACSTAVKGQTQLGFDVIWGKHSACQSGLACVYDGTYQAKCKKLGNLGDACVGTGACAAGLVCVLDQCATALSPVGGPCSIDDDCADDAYCTAWSADAGTRGTCAVRLSAGSSCGNAHLGVDSCHGACPFDGGVCSAFCGAP
jgi:hypothetical protein